MTNELRDRIKNFISSWNDTIDDEFMTLADYDSFMETAINLLEETIWSDYLVCGWKYDKFVPAESGAKNSIMEKNNE